MQWFQLSEYCVENIEVMEKEVDNIISLLNYS